MKNQIIKLTGFTLLAAFAFNSYAVQPDDHVARDIELQEFKFDPESRAKIAEALKFDVSKYLRPQGEIMMDFAPKTRRGTYFQKRRKLGIPQDATTAIFPQAVLKPKGESQVLSIEFAGDTIVTTRNGRRGLTMHETVIEKSAIMGSESFFQFTSSTTDNKGKHPSQVGLGKCTPTKQKSTKDTLKSARTCRLVQINEDNNDHIVRTYIIDANNKVIHSSGARIPVPSGKKRVISMLNATSDKLKEMQKRSEVHANYVAWEHSLKESSSPAPLADESQRQSVADGESTTSPADR